MAPTRPEDAHRIFAENFNAGSVDALVALYAPDAALVPQPGQVASGHAAIREALQAFVGLKGRITIETAYVVQGGDTALLRGHWRLTGTGPDGKILDMAGKSTEVMRRQPDGRWLYVVDHPYGAD